MSNLVEKIKKLRCPSCKAVGRLLAGPFYDRKRVRCLNCGKQLRYGKARKD